jgi:hypothetical protein
VLIQSVCKSLESQTDYVPKPSLVGITYPPKPISDALAYASKSHKSDSLSRYSDCDDWGIHSNVFEELNALWGTHTVDRFATDYNSKCISLIQNAGVNVLRQ